MITKYKLASYLLFASVAPSLLAAAKPTKDAIVIAVSPNGDDHGAGTPAKPFRSP